MNTLSTSNMAKTSYVFISYSRNDDAFVQQLSHDLDVRGIATWIDKPRIKAGTPDWDAAIRYAIGNAKAVILIASPASRQSQYVRDELSLATDVYHCPVYPVWATGIQWVDSVPLGRGATQYIDARGSRYSIGLHELIQALNGAPPVPVRVPPPKVGLQNVYPPSVPYPTQTGSGTYPTGQQPYVAEKGSATKIASTCLGITVAVALIGVILFVVLAGPISSFISNITKNGFSSQQAQSGHLLVTPSPLHLTHTDGTHQGCFYLTGSGWTCTMTLRNDASTGSFYWTTTISPDTITMQESKAIVPLEAGASTQTDIQIPDNFCTSNGTGTVTFKGPENSVAVNIDCNG